MTGKPEVTRRRRRFVKVPVCRPDYSGLCQSHWNSEGVQDASLDGIFIENARRRRVADPGRESLRILFCHRALLPLGIPRNLNDVLIRQFRKLRRRLAHESVHRWTYSPTAILRRLSAANIDLLPIKYEFIAWSHLRIGVVIVVIATVKQIQKSCRNGLCLGYSIIEFPIPFER
jgi:hypothetical protein